MVNNRLYFDTRRTKGKGYGFLRMVISKRKEKSMLSFDIKLNLNQWDGHQVVNHPNARTLNSVIKMKLGAIERILIDMTALGKLTGKTAKEIVYLLEEELKPDKIEARKAAERKKVLAVNGLSARFQHFINLKTNPGTKQLYADTFNKINAFCKSTGSDMEMLSLDDINNSWLIAFEQFCLLTERQNTASRHLRDIRAVLNDAIDDGVTSNYPFRKFKVKKQETKDKSFTSDELRRLFAFKSDVPGERESIDIFKLMFCLIGINSVDLAYCVKPTKGRIEYIRRKTGKLYNIKLEPEALDIIKRYQGKDRLLNLLDRVPNFKTYYRRMEKNLKKVGMVQVPGKKSEGCALLPCISSGSARTSWATIAQEELDIPRDVIAAALGHHTVDVTSTYLRTEWRKKVDEANRKVLDWVFYKKKGIKSEE